MIERKILNMVKSEIATNSKGNLIKVNGNKGTVNIKGQVYPNLDLLNGLIWNDYVGSNVLVSFYDKNLTEGIVVGVVL